MRKMVDVDVTNDYQKGCIILSVENANNDGDHDDDDDIDNVVLRKNDDDVLMLLIIMIIRVQICVLYFL